jgi:hypothetical protein
MKQSVHRNIYVITENGRVISVATSNNRAKQIVVERMNSVTE